MKRTRGRIVTGLRRRAKYILCRLDSGEVMVIHLGMSGRMTLIHPGTARPAPARHDHIIFKTDRGTEIRFNDARRFGLIELIAESDLETHALFAHLGPEPLGNRFSGAYLAEKLDGRTATVKTLLLDQRLVVGVGNIYACEALYRAGIRPERSAGGLNGTRLNGLAIAVRDVLNEAIAAGGSTLRDHRQASGELGYFQHNFRVYGREGEKCSTEGCGGTVERIVQSGRSSFFCRSCQH